MRTQDQTFLASVGFGDADKTNKLHDAACFYLTQPEKLTKLLAFIDGKRQVTEVSYSKPIMGGFARRIVGYSDVTVATDDDRHLLIEVKAGPTPTQRCIQQIETYRPFCYSWTVFVLATLYPLTAIDKDALKAHKIVHIYLDPDQVRDFMERSKNPTTETPF